MLRDFTYIDDIVEGVIRVLDHTATSNVDWNAATPDPATSTAPYRIYNIGNSSPVKLMDFIKAIETACGHEADRISAHAAGGCVSDECGYYAFANGNGV